MSYVKHLVSKKKKRHIEDGFDLDLAYIKPNIVAMGFPSDNLEGVYRNNFDDVVRFLEIKHKDHYKVYNLCSERTYDPARFQNRVSCFPFDDHNAPPFELMEPCCKDLNEWLSADRNNVAIVHCKAGKGRTGVMICAYLLYKRYFELSDDAMKYYAQARTSNDKGVTIPSQRRFITYFGYYMKHQLCYIPKTALLNSITFVGIPTFNSGTCSPSFVVYQTKVVLHKSKTYEVKKTETELEMELPKPLPICGDIKIDVFHKDIFKKERMFVFWFNTFFLEHGVTLNHQNGGGTYTVAKTLAAGETIHYVLHKYELDKANKDKKHKFFPDYFKIRLNITIPVDKDITNNSLTNNDLIDGRTKKAALIPAIQLHKVSTENNDKQSLKALSLQRDTNKLQSREGLLETTGTSAPPSPNSKRLQQCHSSPLSPTTPPGELMYDRNISRSLEVLRVEDEPLSSDDDEEDDEHIHHFPITRV